MSDSKNKSDAEKILNEKKVIDVVKLIFYEQNCTGSMDVDTCNSGHQITTKNKAILGISNDL